ncbi:MAG: tetratricopeptide repeat protein [Spirochaetaceae bacterium]
MGHVKYTGGAAAAVLLFLLLAPSLSASSAEELLEEGKRDFARNDYQSALEAFRNIILDSDMEESHGTAYYWVARSYIAMKMPDKAEENLEFFLSQYEGHSLYSDALYQKGRLLYMQEEYQKSIRWFYRFIEGYPEHRFTGNAYYWVGESLYSLGHYEKAESIFTVLVEDYPRSFKAEAGHYRLSLIDLKRREEELLKLLKLSHEEYLKSLEAFNQKEKSYEQAISEYQRKLAAAAGSSGNELAETLNRELEEKNRRLESLEEENDKLKSRNTALRKSLEDSGVDIPDELDTEHTGQRELRKLLDAKSKALSLKEYYINELIKRQGGM